ncbi:MAG: IS110 family transposase, partial [Thiolinea sp.]
MKNTIITIDLAKSVFELVIANQHYRITQRQRLDRQGFTEFMNQQSPAIVVMEACGSSHHWGRQFRELGHEVVLLPVQYVRPYRRRNKTDRADCEAMLEAYRCDGMKPVVVKSLEQQELQLMHRLREQWKQTRVKRLNFLRGVFREQGIPLPTGEREALREANAHVGRLSSLSLQLLQPVLAELKTLESDMQALEQQIARLTRGNETVANLQTIPGIGLLISS